MNECGTSRRLEAALFSRLPERLHFRGEPTEWVRLTRPGERLHSFLEGPCFDANGDLWLADVPYGRIFCVSPDGNWRVALEYDGEPHALRPCGDGTFLVADHRRGLLTFDPVRGKVDVLLASIGASPFRGLGDLAVAPNGDVWLTDPGRSSLSDPTGRVLRLKKGARELEIVLPNVPYPNGIALSPDGKLVYVSATRANAVWRFLADAPDPGLPMVGTFIQLSGGLGPDGLAVDKSGRLAITQAQAGRVYLVDALGDPIATIVTPGGLWTTACAFAPDQSSIYILEARTGGVYRCAIRYLQHHKYRVTIMLTKESLRGFVPAVVTPFDAKGAILEDDFGQMVEYLIGIGADGICVAGDNGESWALDMAERQRLTRIAVDRAAGRVPVMTGATAPSASQTIHYAAAAREAGASGILVMPQTYVLKASRDELLRRFELLAKAVDVPVVLYNSPRRATIDLTVDDVGALLSVAPIVGIKESSRDMAHLTRLLLTLGDRMSVMVGPAYYILAGSALGAAGFISSGPEFLGKKAGRLMRMGRSAPDAEYVSTHRQLSILYETLMSLGTWPSALKAGLGLLGLPAGVPRDPLLPLAPAALDRLRRTLEELDLMTTGNPAKRATA